MKYFVQFPIQKNCNLQCNYCFHQNFFTNIGPYENGKRYPLGFTIDQWNIWRNKFLSNSEEILISPQGGETFHSTNVPLILELIKSGENSIQTYEFLSNGISPVENYYSICNPFSSKIRRIGFTYHRSMLNDSQKKLFEENILRVKDLNIKVYVKELLILKHKEEILKDKEYWESQDIEVKIQDFKGTGESKFYSEEDKNLIDFEYKHPLNKFCTCLDGYKSISIFGYDESRGFVIACWRDKKIIGNIPKMWFNPNFNVDRITGTSKRNVVGVPKFYLEHDASFYD